MTIIFPLRLAASHRDYDLLKRLEDAIYRAAGGQEKFETKIPAMLRKAIDEVIDAPRSGRLTLDEIDKTEKTYLGTKIEILLRNILGLKRGRHLDLLIDGVEVDVKNTIGRAWTIPNETLDHPCILISTNEITARCSFGLIFITSQSLNSGRNRDQKTTIKAAELVNVHWLLRDAPYPENFWQGLEPESRHSIMNPVSGTDRVAMLFRLRQRQPISRKLIEVVAQQKDFMKRIRKNGGARDQLAREGIAVLWGKKHRSLIAELGLTKCSTDEFISIKPDAEADVLRLRILREID